MTTKPIIVARLTNPQISTLQLLKRKNPCTEEKPSKHKRVISSNSIHQFFNLVNLW